MLSKNLGEVAVEQAHVLKENFLFKNYFDGTEVGPVLAR
jgi:hypothetical protein